MRYLKRVHQYGASRSQFESTLSPKEECGTSREEEGCSQKGSSEEASCSKEGREEASCCEEGREEASCCEEGREEASCCEEGREEACSSQEGCRKEVVDSLRRICSRGGRKAPSSAV